MSVKVKYAFLETFKAAFSSPSTSCSFLSLLLKRKRETFDFWGMTNKKGRMEMKVSKPKNKNHFIVSKEKHHWNVHSFYLCVKREQGKLLVTINSPTTKIGNLSYTLFMRKQGQTHERRTGSYSEMGSFGFAKYRVSQIFIIFYIKNTISRSTKFPRSELKVPRKKTRNQ